MKSNVRSKRLFVFFQFLHLHALVFRMHLVLERKQVLKFAVITRFDRCSHLVAHRSALCSEFAFVFGLKTLLELLAHRLELLLLIRSQLRCAQDSFDHAVAFAGSMMTAASGEALHPGMPPRAESGAMTSDARCEH